MKPLKRCPGCIRPVCQRILTLRGCKEKRVEDIFIEPFNEYKMYDFGFV